MLGYLCPYLAVLKNLGWVTASLWTTVLGSTRETEPIGVCVYTPIKSYTVRNWQASKSQDMRGKVLGRDSGDLMVQIQSELGRLATPGEPAGRRPRES